MVNYEVEISQICGLNKLESQILTIIAEGLLKWMNPIELTWEIEIDLTKI